MPIRDISLELLISTTFIIKVYVPLNQTHIFFWCNTKVRDYVKRVSVWIADYMLYRRPAYHKYHTMKIQFSLASFQFYLKCLHGAWDRRCGNSRTRIRILEIVQIYYLFHLSDILQFM